MDESRLDQAMESSLKSRQDFFCSQLSLEGGEDLFGTASQVEVYLLLEYNGAWGAKAFEESDLPVEVKDHLSAATRATPYSKIFLIKSYPGLIEPGFRFFVAVSREQEQNLYTFHLEGYEELLSLDILSIVAGDEAYLNKRSSEGLFLVCTNGRRDFCCARSGLPFYMEMYNRVDASVWQCTHVGGHRFAANAICLPHGVLYGRLSPEEAVGFVEAYHQEKILLDHYRGRTCYPKVAQAADYYLRKDTGELGLQAFHLLSAVQVSEEEWEIRFHQTGNGEEHALRIAVETTGRYIYQSCRPDKTAAVVNYHRLEHRVFSQVDHKSK